MKLVGYSVVRRAAGLAGVYLPLGPLTVVLGVNDAGKSTLLRAVNEDLVPRPYGEDPSTDRGVFFAEVTDDELLAMLPSDSDRSDIHREWPLGGYSRDAVRETESPSNLATYLKMLRERATSDPASFGVVLDALSDSRLICLEPLAPGAYVRRSLAVYWCLPPIGTLPTEVAAALRASELDPFRRDRLRAEVVP